MVFSSKVAAVLNSWRPIFLNSTIYALLLYLTKTTAAQNGVALSYHKVRGLYFQAVVFVRSIISASTAPVLPRSSTAQFYRAVLPRTFMIDVKQHVFYT